MMAPRKARATSRKAEAIPWPDSTRRAMPPVTVKSQTTMPPGSCLRVAPSGEHDQPAGDQARQEGPGRRRHATETEAMSVDRPSDAHERARQRDRAAPRPGVAHTSADLPPDPYSARWPARIGEAPPGRVASDVFVGVGDVDVVFLRQSQELAELLKTALHLGGQVPARVPQVLGPLGRHGLVVLGFVALHRSGGRLRGRALPV